MYVMRRLMTRDEVRNLVFGAPSIETGNAITRNDVSRALMNNAEVRELLSTREFEHILNVAKEAKPFYANYGCYGIGEDADYYVVEVYQFRNTVHLGEVLTVALSRLMDWRLKPSATGKSADELTTADVEVVYVDEPIAEVSNEKFTELADEQRVMINGLSLRLINVDDHTPPDKFALMVLRGEV